MRYIKLFEGFHENENNGIAEEALELFLVDKIDKIKVSVNDYSDQRKPKKLHNEIERIILESIDRFDIESLSYKITQLKDYYKNEYDIKYSYSYSKKGEYNMSGNTYSDTFPRNKDYRYFIIHFLNKKEVSSKLGDINL